MKKTLLAAALLAGFATAGVAQAETSVTLYGILDAGYGYSQHKYDGKLTKNAKSIHSKSTTSGLRTGVQAGNRWGLRGSEDLGDGLRAIFTLEQGFNLGNGEGLTTRNFHRQAWVGLASDDWGTFTMGRQYNAGASMVYDSFAIGGFGIADPDAGFGGIGYGNRMDNSFKYVTPSFSGFQAAIAYGSNNETITRGDTDGAYQQAYSAVLGGPGARKFVRTDTDRHNWLSAGLKYANGPLTLAASYDRQDQDYVSPTTSWNLGASYDFEVVKVALVYGQDRHGKMGWGAQSLGAEDSFATATNAVLSDKKGDTWDNFKSHNWYLALSAPVGAGNLGVSWTHSRSNLDEAYAGGDKIRSKNLNVYHAHYTYPLSKRTNLYVYGNYGTGMMYLKNAKSTEAGVGMLHRF